MYEAETKKEKQRERERDFTRKTRIRTTMPMAKATNNFHIQAKKDEIERGKKTFFIIIT